MNNRTLRKGLAVVLTIAMVMSLCPDLPLFDAVPAKAETVCPTLGDLITVDGVVYEVASENLFANPSFEENTDGWYKTTSTAGAVGTALGTFSRSTAQSADGDYSLLCGVNGGAASEGSLAGFAPLNNGSAAPSGTKYLLGFQYYAPGTGITITLGLAASNSAAQSTEACGGYGNSGSAASPSVSCNVTTLTANTWNTIQTVATSNGAVSYGLAWARWCNGGYFDDFYCVRVTPLFDSAKASVAFDASVNNILTEDIYLPATYRSMTISWASSNTSVLSIGASADSVTGMKTATYTAPSTVTPLTLTATFSDGTNSETQVYNFIAMPSSTDYTSNMVVKYDFDANRGTTPSSIADSSGNSGNGTVTGTITVSDDGIASFPGGGASKGYIKMPDAVKNAMTGSFTYTAWLNESSTDNATKPHALFDFASGNYVRLFFQRVPSTNVLTFNDRAVNAGVTYTDAGEFEDQWGHVALVFNNGTSYLYINGTQVTSWSTAYTGYPSTQTNAWIGHNQWNNGDNPDYAGLMDDVRFYSSALSAANIANIYASSYPGQYVPVRLRYYAGNNFAGYGPTVYAKYADGSYTLDESYVAANITYNGNDYFYNTNNANNVKTVASLSKSGNELSLYFEGGATPSGYQSVTVETVPTRTPVMPATVTLEFDGSNLTQSLDVVWDDISVNSYMYSRDEAYSFTATGSVPEGPTGFTTVTATVVVLALDYIEPISDIRTNLGVAPQLPASVYAVFKDMSNIASVWNCAIYWNSYDSELLNEYEAFEVTGNIQYTGDEVSVNIIPDFGKAQTTIATADTYVQANDAAANHGSDTTMQLSGDYAATWRYGLIRFTNAAASLGISDSSDVISAAVQLYVAGYNNDTGRARAFEVYAFDDALADEWVENTFTYNDFAPYLASKTKLGEYSIAASGAHPSGYISIDVTDYVREHIMGTSSISFYVTSTQNPYTITTREGGANGPRLSVEMPVDDVNINVAYRGEATYGGANYTDVIRANDTTKYKYGWDYTRPASEIPTYVWNTDTKKTYKYNASASNNGLLTSCDEGDYLYLNYDIVNVDHQSPVTVITYTGQQPTLPSEVTVYFEDGYSESRAVTWAAMQTDTDEDNIYTVGVKGVRKAVGTVDNTYDSSGNLFAVEATVNVFDTMEKDGETVARADFEIVYVGEVDGGYQTLYRYYPELEAGTVYTLSSDDTSGIKDVFTVTEIMNGTYGATEYDSIITKYTDSVILNEIDQKVYLLCEYNDTFGTEIAADVIKKADGTYSYKVDATLYNGTSAAETATVIIAVFNKADDSLTRVVREDEISLPARMTSLTTRTYDEVAIDPDTQYADAFLWRDFDTMRVWTDNINTLDEASYNYSVEVDAATELLAPTYAGIVAAISSKYATNTSTTENVANAIYQWGQLSAATLLDNQTYYNAVGTWAASKSYSSTIYLPHMVYSGLYMQEKVDAAAISDMTSDLSALSSSVSGVTAEQFFERVPALARMYSLTKDEAYLDKIYAYYNYAMNNLYNSSTNLFGTTALDNAYIVAALASAAYEMPETYSGTDTFKSGLETLAVTLINKAVTDGDNAYWTANLTESGSANVEATALITYALYKMMYSGEVMDGLYAPAACRSWHYLANTSVTGAANVGAFLLAASTAGYWTGDAEAVLAYVDQKTHNSVTMVAGYPHYYANGIINNANLVINGDFEHGVDLVEQLALPTAYGTMYVTRSSLAMRKNDGHEGTNYSYGLFSGNTFYYYTDQTVEGVDYDFSMYINIPDGYTTNDVEINVSDSGAVASLDFGAPDADGWIEVYGSFTAGSSDFALTVAFEGVTGNRTDILKIDDITLYRSETNYSPIAATGDAWIPIAMLGEYFGYTVTESNGVYTVTDSVNGRTVTVNGAASTYSTSGGASGSFTHTLFELGDSLYVPASEFAPLFDMVCGISEVTVDGETLRLITVGDREAIFYDADSAQADYIASIIAAGFKPAATVAEIEPTGSAITLDANNVWASYDAGTYTAHNAVDGSLSSYWYGVSKGTSSSATPASLTIDLDGLYTFDSVDIAFYVSGGSRNYIYSIQASVDGSTWVDAKSYGTTGALSSTTLNTYELDRTVTASYVRINVWGYGSTAAGYISEVSVDGIEAVATFSSVDTSNFDSLTVNTAVGTSATSAADNWAAFAQSETAYFTNTANFPAATQTPATKGDDTSWTSPHSLNDKSNYSGYYTPSLGTGLYAKIEYMPAAAGLGTTNKALHLYDTATRTTDSATGQGGLIAERQLNIPSGDAYTVSFVLYPNGSTGVPSSNDYAGFGLCSGANTGGADVSNLFGFQMRMHNTGSAMAFRVLNSVYMEGTALEASFVGTNAATEATFALGVPYYVDLEVNPARKQVGVRISDGSTEVFQTVPYAYSDHDHVVRESWDEKTLDYLVFDTGCGGIADFYVDDVKVSYNRFSEAVITSGDVASSTTLWTQNFNSTSNTKYTGSSISGLGYNGGNIVLYPIEEGSTDYDESLGSSLYAGTNGSRFYLYDNVARTTDASAGAGGIIAGIPIPTIESGGSIYEVSFIMRTSGGSYGGFSLSGGVPTGTTDTTNLSALQLRFSDQTDGIQLNAYTNATFNGGSFNAAMGTGSGNRFSKNTDWTVELTVNPSANTVKAYVSDGSKSATKTFSFLSGFSGNINYLVFNTGVGATGSTIYVDDIKVVDTGIVQSAAYLAATNGIVRFEGTSGTGYFLYYTSNSWGNSLSFGQGNSPDTTRFVERPGLIDPENGVSYELMGYPGYYLSWKNNGSTVQVLPYREDDTVKAQMTFVKTDGSAAGSSDSTARSIHPYQDPTYYWTGTTGTMSAASSASGNYFYYRDEYNRNRASDNFKGYTRNHFGVWIYTYPWSNANYHNYPAICRESNLDMVGDYVFYSVDRIGSSEWPTASNGETGYQDSTSPDTGWYKWQGYSAVQSYNKYVFNKGCYIGAYMMQPNSTNGFWTGYWLNGRDSWPPETDIVEFLSSTGTVWYTALHVTNAGYGSWQSSPGGLSHSQCRTTWHKVELDWDYEYMRFYANGTNWLSLNGSNVTAQKNLYLILNQGIGGWEAQPTSSMEWYTGWKIDWVRSFQYY